MKPTDAERKSFEKWWADQLQGKESLISDRGYWACWQAARQTAPVADAEPVGYLPERELSRLKSGHDGHLRSPRFGPTKLEVEVCLFTADQLSAARQSGINEGLQPLIEALVVRHIYTAEHDNDPSKALNDLLSWEVSVNLDPAVSSDARKLINEGLRMAAEVCEGRAGVRGTGAWVALTAASYAIKSLIKE